MDNKRASGCRALAVTRHATPLRPPLIVSFHSRDLAGRQASPARRSKRVARTAGVLLV